MAISNAPELAGVPAEQKAGAVSIIGEGEAGRQRCGAASVSVFTRSVPISRRDGVAEKLALRAVAGGVEVKTGGSSAPTVDSPVIRKSSNIPTIGDVGAIGLQLEADEHLRLILRGRGGRFDRLRCPGAFVEGRITLPEERPMCCH